MILYACTIFLSAFLLFQVQPIIAKIILPWFGGSAAVWTTCMLFFQIELLLGYLYAHWSIRYLTAKRQAWLHSALLAGSILLLPIIPSSALKPLGGENPSIRILMLLTATVGLPYFLLSTTSPLLQAWYARAGKGAIPYRLFALSNLGSMLALLSYPVLIEPLLATRRQAYIWSGSYIGLAILCVYTAWRSSAGYKDIAFDENPAAAGGEAAPGLRAHLIWVSLAACPSVLLLAVTNHLTQDVAAIPFLWIVPLTLYLLTFILCFDAPGWYRRNIFLTLLLPSLGGMAYMLAKGEGVSLKITLAAFSAAFFVACMVCHGELSRLKPHPRYLTSFYLMLSIGGAMGGLFVGLVAPYLFNSYLEFPIAIEMVAVLAMLVLTLDKTSQFHMEWLSPSWILAFSFVIALAIFLGRTVTENISGYRVVARNFYGSLRVRQSGDTAWDRYRTLLHGSINHGEQWTHPDRRRDPITYYCPDSGVGRVMQARRDGVPQTVGVLGLGAGTLSAFGRPGDHYKIYEINPLVLRLAKTEFTFIGDSLAKVDIVLGDARLSLEREPDHIFDTLIVDAFSGDSVPVHLLTEEAFALYFRLLKKDGFLAVHVSNKYLNLPPVVECAVEAFHKAAYMVDADEDDSGTCFGTTWIVIADDPKVFERPAFRGAGHALKAQAGLRIWTDDYSNMFRILK